MVQFLSFPNDTDLIRGPPSLLFNVWLRHEAGHPHLVLNSKMYGVNPPLSHMPSWHGA